MYPHLMAEEVAAFVKGRVDRARSRRLAIHLLGCPKCSVVFQRRHPTQGNQRLAEVLGLQRPPSEWSAEVPRCALEIAENDAGLALWPALKDLATHEQCLRLRNLPEERVTPGLILAVLEASRARWQQSATEAAELAAVALELVLTLLANGYPWLSLLAKLAAEGLGYLGNAERIKGHLRTAEPKLKAAIRLALAADPRDARLLGTLTRLWAKLGRDAEDYSLAQSLYDLAEVCYRAVDDRECLAVIELDKANLLAEQGERRLCAERLQRLTTAERFSSLPPLVQLSATQSLAFELCELGKFFQAGKLIPKVERLAAAVGGELNQLKVHWVKARIAAGSGRDEAAELYYCSVRDRWVALEHSMDAALVTLELAELYLAWGRPDEAREQALVVLEVCRSLEGMRREELEAVATLARAEEDCLDRTLQSLRSLLETARSPARGRVAR